MPADASIVLPIIAAAVGLVATLSVRAILRAEGRLRDHLERAAIAATAATQTTAALAQRELEDWDRRLMQFTLEYDPGAMGPLRPRRRYVCLVCEMGSARDDR